MEYSKMIHWEVSQAIHRIADRQQVDFDSLSLEGKQVWLKGNIDAVLHSVVTAKGDEWRGILKYRVFLVEKDGEAVLYFERQ